VSRIIYLYDDPADVAWFLPFTQSRPIGELRYGAWLLRERWEAEWGTVAGHITSKHLAKFAEGEAPPVVTDVPSEEGRWFIRSSFVPDHGLEVDLEGKRDRPTRLQDAQGTDVGCYLPPGAGWTGAAFPETWPARPIPGRRLLGAWQIIGDLAPVLRGDLETRRRVYGGARVPPGCTVLGDAGHVLVDERAQVEPLVVFDVRNGPVWVRAGAEIRSGSRLAGPLVVGEASRIVGGQVRESSIGPRCVVHGEVSSSVFVGYSNKAHDGFLGHSVIGRWVNLGAGTITSNLKNTYGPVRLNLGPERIETGMTFLGSLIGDHAKTAIGTMLPTGCVIGTGANIFGSKRPESYVPAFAWGNDEPERRVACRMFLQTASRVLPRRDVVFDDAMSAYLQAVFEYATGRPCD